METKDRLTINLNLDWRVLLVLGIIVALIAVTYSRTNAQSEAAKPADESAPSAASAVTGGRKFYLTSQTKFGDQASTACASGFHMASFWEILDVSNLSYYHEFAYAKINADSGFGPPAGLVGWVRTGYTSSFSSAPGTGNCMAWSSQSAGYDGTAVRLTNNWVTPPGSVGFWTNEHFSCNINVSVWCIED